MADNDDPLFDDVRALDEAGFPVAQGTGELPDLVTTAEIDPEDLLGEMHRVSGTLALINARYADSHRDYLLAKLELDRVHAQMLLAVRAAAEQRGIKITEASVEATIERTPEHHEARLALIRAEAERERLLVAARAIAAKKDMLGSINQRLCAELRADPLASGRT